jgi:hypothetical protein
VGDNPGYWVGCEGGYRLLRRYGRYIRPDGWMKDDNIDPHL